MTNLLLRPLISISLLAGMLTMGGESIAASVSAPRGEEGDPELAKIGFLDFKTLLFSPSTGDNLDGVFNQIQFIGPDMFKNATLGPGVLRKFKRSKTILIPSGPIPGSGDRDLEVLKLDVRTLNGSGKLSPVSSDLVDAILTDIKDNISNHGVSWSPNPAVGRETTAYFNAATQKVLDLIAKLEKASPAVPRHLQGKSTIRSAGTMSPLLPIFLFGSALLTLGLLWRRARRKSRPSPKTAPAAFFDLIRQSPIRIDEKSV